MTDHELLIQIIEQNKFIAEKVADNNEHIVVMNSEQGVQANRLTGVEVRLAAIQWVVVIVMGALITGIVAAGIKNILKKGVK